MDLRDKVIVTCCLNGAKTTKADTPYVPISPDEVIQQGVEAYRAGAAALHIHARDEAGKPTADIEVYRKITEGLRAQCPDVILNLSTGIRSASEDERLNPIYLGPDLVSLNSGSFNRGAMVYDNSQAYIDKVAHACKEHGVKPEFELFEAGMIQTSLDLLSRGLVREPLTYNIVFGMSGVPTNTKNLLHYVEQLPAGSRWVSVDIGDNIWEHLFRCLALGSDVRVGLEDCIYINKGVLAKSNAEMVEKAVDLVRAIGKEPATPSEARAMWGIAG